MERIPIVMLSYNRPEYLYRTLRSLYNTNLGFYDLHIIDNGSKDPKTISLLKNVDISAEITILPEPKTIGEGKNIGIEHCLKYHYLSHFIAIIDNDMLFKYNCLHEAFMEAIKLIAEGQHLGILGLWRHPSHKILKEVNDKIVKTTDLPGNCWIINREILEEGLRHPPKTGGGDTEFVRMVRKAGWKVFTFREPILKHIGILKARGGLAYDFKPDKTSRMKYKKEWFDESDYIPLPLSNEEDLEWIRGL